MSNTRISRDLEHVFDTPRYPSSEPELTSADERLLSGPRGGDVVRWLKQGPSSAVKEPPR